MSGGGKGSSSGDTQTVTTTNTPWGPQQPYMTDVWGTAQNIFQSGGPQFYPGATYTPMSPQTEMGLDLITGRALQGSPLQDAAQAENLYTTGGGYLGAQPSAGLLNSTMGGSYLNSNPWLDATYDKAASSVMSGLNATFGEAGRTGGGAHMDTLGTGLADLATNIYGQNYQAERDRMMQAAGLSNQAFASERDNMMQATGLAPMLAQMDYADFDRLLQAGGAIEGQAGEQLADRMGRWDFYQTGAGSPWSQLGNYASTVFGGGSPGGTSTTEQPLYGGSPLTGALGGGLAGAGMFSALGGSGALGPWGYAIPAATTLLGALGSK